MATDGGLYQIFPRHLPHFHWQRMELGTVGRGVPDVNFCVAGREGWIEDKFTAGWRVPMRPEQVAWAERRARAGGAVFVAVRRVAGAGPRRGAAVDELWLFVAGLAARALLHGRIDAAPGLLLRAEGGPAQWPWAEVESCLLQKKLSETKQLDNKNEGQPSLVP